MSASTQEANFLIGEHEHEGDVTVVISDVKRAGGFIDALIARPEALRRVRAIDFREADHVEESEEEAEEALGTNEEGETVTDTGIEETIDSRADAEEKDGISGEEAARLERLRKWKAKLKADATKSARLCAPIIRLLEAIASTPTPNLQLFNWPRATDDLPGARPLTYWHSLFAHAPTLRTLNIDYTVHELFYLSALARDPPSSFPALRSLTLDATGAHGDDGTAVNALLKACPHLETLTFSWPNCDLDNCQIQNLSFDYDFEHLKRLSLLGWNCAPEALDAFIERHSGRVEVFSNGVCGPYEDNDDVNAVASEGQEGVVEGEKEEGEGKAKEGEEEKEKETASLTSPKPEVSMFANLQILHCSRTSSPSSSLATWFDKAANRPIRHLRLESHFGMARLLEELAAVDRSMLARLEVLELTGHVEMWEGEPDSDDSDEEGNTCKKNVKDLDTSTNAEEAFTQDENALNKSNDNPIPTPTVQNLTALLPLLPSLTELALTLDNPDDGPYYDRPLLHPALLTLAHLQLILDALPQASKIRALRLSDARERAVPRTVFENEEATLVVPQGLEFLSWDCVRERVVYKVRKTEGESVRVERGEERRVVGEWWEETILG